MKSALKAAYRTVMEDHFPPTMEISFTDGTGGPSASTWGSGSG